MCSGYIYIYIYIYIFSISRLWMVSPVCKIWIMVASNAHEHYCRSQSPLGSMYTWMFHGHAFLAPVDRDWCNQEGFSQVCIVVLSESVCAILHSMQMCLVMSRRSGQVVSINQDCSSLRWCLNGDCKSADVLFLLSVCFALQVVD